MRPVEYKEGFNDASVYQYENPYDFFDQYIEHFQYCIGYQASEHILDTEGGNCFSPKNIRANFNL